MLRSLFCSFLGIPPPPQFLSLSARAVPHEKGHEGGHGGVEVFFSACDRGQILHYTIEVAMDANFTHIIDNGTVEVGNDTRKADVDGLQTNTTYWMRMKAIGRGGESMYSAAQSVNTLEGMHLLVCGVCVCLAIFLSVRQSMVWLFCMFCQS